MISDCMSDDEKIEELKRSAVIARAIDWYNSLHVDDHAQFLAAEEDLRASVANLLEGE